MPKCRRRLICKEPNIKSFIPENGQNLECISLTIDEYETIRLIDLLGMNQIECAEKLNVARTTAQLIYNNAHLKLAQALVYGLGIKIDGGNYEVCDGNRKCKDCYLKIKHKNTSYKGEKNMRIACTYENGEIFQHFGRCENFKIYDVEDEKILNVEVVNSNGTGHGALAGFLRELGVNILICGGIGMGAQNAIAENNIELIAGQSGNTDELVNLYLKGELINSGANCNHHHEHEEGHNCGHAGCCH